MGGMALRVIGVLLMLTALAIPLSRAPDRAVETLVARWAPPPSDFLDVKGQLVHYRDEGPRDDATPLVLLHGTAASLHTWEGWVKALKGKKRVITFDMPGFGLTGPFAGSYAADDYRGDTLAKFVIDLLDTLGVQRVAIGGNSLGGEVAWRVAALAPARVERLILVDASGTDFKSESVGLGFVLARIPGINRVFEEVLPRALVAQTVLSVYGDAGKVSPELVDRYYELMLRSGNRHALGLRLQQMEPGEHVNKIAQLKLPTLILWGGRDKLIPRKVAHELQHLIARSELLVYEDLGHVPQEEDPALTVVAVKGFLGL